MTLLVKPKSLRNVFFFPSYTDDRKCLRADPSKWPEAVDARPNRQIEVALRTRLNYRPRHR